MAVSMMSSATVARTAAPIQASGLMSSFTGKSMASFPMSRKASVGKRSNNAGRIKCMKKPFVHRTYHASPGYYDGRYWTMWKLPMFGCTDSTQVLNEVDECVKEYPNAYVRIIGFDNVRQVQCISFIAFKPPSFKG
ncbi:hypothetical protein RHGRI_028705 [Rhododendron griersonianum]|uniref:Ribulose bisphosphate carboxylase small subunit domain-containing protein n=1 Tax=Rhododendron griersonianum TaxID=479676 RepID=A0AAV6IIR9_9ERIC|nr:hypothetical protein RHGRI_028705 [Rhododendron griersonianum]